MVSKTSASVPVRQECTLSELHLDIDNPRLGGIGASNKRTSERELLDQLAENHDLSDVLSSISQNGFFNSEPLVGAINKGNRKTITIVEGNRRLAACLILAGDERAKNQSQRRKLYLPTLFKPEDTIPVLVYDWTNKAQRKQLLPYLGVRHIVGPMEWDPYAKAAWIADVVAEGLLDLSQIAKMIGDKNRTASRLLDAYHFVNQVEDAGVYNPHNSQNKNGRGTKTYPFSWVYNALDYDKVRSFVGLGSRTAEPKANPIDKTHINDAGLLMRLLFGDDEKPAAISDSREIKQLASALTRKDAVRELRSGTPVKTVLDSLRPVPERAEELLVDAKKKTDEVVKILVDASAEEAKSLHAPAKLLGRSVVAVRKALASLENDDISELEGD